MNGYAYFIVNHHLDYLLEQAANERRIASLFPKPSLRDRIVSAAVRVSRIFDPIDLSGPVLPTLENYPYRG